MPIDHPDRDKREFFRYRYEHPVHFKIVCKAGAEKTLPPDMCDAVSKNLSASGILFTSSYLPEISSILALDLDYRTTRICQEIEERALITNGKLIGKVVRIEANENGTFDVGVAFVTKTESMPFDINFLT